jgi:glucosamine-6-phosphate deaminase
MKLQLVQNPAALGRVAANFGADIIRSALKTHGHANVIVATGASQLAMLEVLVKAPDIDWSLITVFHLDEYIGLPESHSASFRRYLRERFVQKLPQAPEFIPVDGDAPDLDMELARLNLLLAGRAVDLCFAGIGENGHLAFNDPPADFEVDKPYIAVDLDEACRRQQFGEGWFKSMDEVPRRAISMSVRQIMRSQTLVLTVPDQRKAAATKAAIEGPVQPSCPASIVQRHNNCTVFLDPAAASLLTRTPTSTD